MEIITNSRYSLKAVTGYNKESNEIVISFRGSSNIPNFRNDGKDDLIAYDKDGCSDCHVHEGFSNMYGSYSADCIKSV